jgi:sulfur carrier protein
MGNTTERVSFILCFFVFTNRKGSGEMKVNGTMIPLQENQSLADFLEAQQVDIRIIAVERNGEIVPKSTYQVVMLTDGDTLKS